MSDCVFCQIAKGTAPATIVCEGKDWLAFFPLDPATPGHTLIIPRAHVANLWQADTVLGSEMMAAAMKVGHAIDTALTPDGMNLITSAGTAAEQTIFHLHLHIVPRWSNGGSWRIWPTSIGKNVAGMDEEIRQAYRELSQ